MNLDNGKISERQAFRMGILENIAIGMVIIPYITVNVAGSFHFFGFLVGLVLTFVYGGLLFFFWRRVPEGIIAAVNKRKTFLTGAVDVIYILRFIVKAAVILTFFGSAIQKYLLNGMSLWVLIIPFAIICGYGAARDIEKRGRLMELLFWWMIVPLILVAAFSISNIHWKALPQQLFSSAISRPASGILLAGYLVMLVLSSCELLMFTFTRQTEHSWKNPIRTLIWIFIAVFLSYIFVMGILGNGWAAGSSTASLNVMEAAAFPGGIVERMDYPVLSFWIIGVFAVISGYMFYTKEFAEKLFCVKNTPGSFLTMSGIILLVLVLAGCMQLEGFAKSVFCYIIWADSGLSLLLPLVVVCGRKI